MPTLSGTFFLTQLLLTVAVLLQTFELLLIKNSWAAIWTWDVLKNDYSKWPRHSMKLVTFFLNDNGFLFVLDLRILFAILLLAFPNPFVFLGLLLTTLLLCLRWRGTYNGGSDTMTVVILLAITVAAFFKHHGVVVRACFWYIALQTCLSYFIAGVVKLRNSKWRNGRALSLLVTKTNYEIPVEFQKLFSNHKVSLICCWLILIFECSFPVALLHPALCQIYIALAVCFHLANFFIFGLNRFAFAWMAAYPALILASHWMSGFLTLR